MKKIILLLMVLPMFSFSQKPMMKKKMEINPEMKKKKMESEKKKKLYLAPSEEIFHQLRQVNANRLLLICHNPGISEFSQEILSQWPIHPQFESFPTCSTCIIDFDLTDWSSLKFESGKIKKFITPRDLGVF